MSRETPQLTAVKAAAQAIFGGTRDVLTHDEAQRLRDANTLPPRYVLVEVRHRVGAPRYACGRTPARGWRALFLIVGSEAERGDDRALLDDLTDMRLTALNSTGLTFESDDENGDGDLLSSWTFATPKETP